MAKVSTYLNFSGNTEEAFNYYKTVFGTEFDGKMQKFSDVPADATQMPLSDEDRNKVMHVALPILGGHMLMGTDATQATGFEVKMGNNFYIELIAKLFSGRSRYNQVVQMPQTSAWFAQLYA